MTPMPGTTHKRRYIIWAQPLTRSCGTKVLYTLYEKLRACGYEALLFCPAEHRDEYEYIDVLDAETLARDIVVYPEIVWGNPLRFQHAVRYVLFFPGALAGEKHYHESERVFTWAEPYYPGAPSLFWSTLDNSLFYDEQLPKTRDCYFVNKRRAWKTFKELEGATEITMRFPATREELAHLLKTTRVLYTFDRYSALNDEALACGAEVRIVTEDGLVEYAPHFKNGVPDDLAARLLRAFCNATQHYAYSGPLQPEEPFFRYYTGIFTMAAARCAALGAWDNALDFARKACLGNPLQKPGIQAPDDTGGVSTADGALPPMESEAERLERFLHTAARGLHEEAARIMAPMLLRKIKAGNRPVSAAYAVLLSHCFDAAGRHGDALAAETLALAADPLNALAVQLNVERALEAGKRNQALFLICRLAAPFLQPLVMEKAAPAMALFGMLAARDPEKAAALAGRIPGVMNGLPSLPSPGREDPEWKKALHENPLPTTLAAMAGETA